MRVVVTGAQGFLGWHASVRLHALNCAARFDGRREPIDLVRLGRAGLNDQKTLAAALRGARAVLHFAGVNRGSDAAVEDGNPAIAGLVAAALEKSGDRPHIVYANSVHAGLDTPYGRSKAFAGEILAGASGRFTDLVLPHVFGEGARPHYNSVTATLIACVHDGRKPELDPGGRVCLLHAGEAATLAIEAVMKQHTGTIVPDGRAMSVSSLWGQLAEYHRLCSAGVFPDLSDPIDLALYTSYRAGAPKLAAQVLRVNSDPRGTLFEAVKGGGGGQVFLSRTQPGKTRGDHFHLSKAERFVVLEGRARIRLRKVFSETVQSFEVTGSAPMALDIPTLHSHSIENTGDGPLLTLFWAHEIFDPAVPDTYSDPVLRGDDEKTEGDDNPRNAARDHPPFACHGTA